MLLCNHIGKVCHSIDLWSKDCFADIFSFYYIYVSGWGGQIRDYGDKGCSLHLRGTAEDKIMFLGLSFPLEQDS